jgi:hypothetical protein
MDYLISLWSAPAFELHFGEIFASDIDVAIKTYYADYQSVCFTKKG